MGAGRMSNNGSGKGTETRQFEVSALCSDDLGEGGAKMAQEWKPWLQNRMSQREDGRSLH